jgi:hypothetical protein
MAAVNLCGRTAEAIPRSATCVDFSGRPDLDWQSGGSWVRVPSPPPFVMCQISGTDEPSEDISGPPVVVD